MPLRTFLAHSAVVLLFLSVVAPAQAATKRTIVVLAFGGPEATGARSFLVKQLKKRYRVLPGERLLDACKQLGIAMQRGSNLARCATELGAVAVVGGKTSRTGLTLAVYSGKTGNALVSGVVPWGRRVSRTVRQQAVRLVISGLRQAPRQVAPPPRPPAAEVEPSAPISPGGMEFEPEAGVDAPADPAPQQPQPTDDLEPQDPYDDPLAEFAPDPGIDSDMQPTERKPKRRAPVQQFDPRVSGLVGVGVWMRSFAFTDPLGSAPTYDSGLAPALRIMASGRPLAFFFDNFAGDFFLRLRYQMSIGLKSGVRGSDSQLSTSMSELLIDGGYHWNVLSRASSPRVDFSLGYGMLDFSIDWPNALDKKVPDASYSFLLIGTTGRIPFSRYLGVHAGFDYRVVFGTGEVEDDASWYGPASAGGLAGTAGLNANYKGFVGTLEYTYTRFFYAFTDDLKQRQADGNKVAGGAVDQYHAAMLNFGYSY